MFKLLDVEYLLEEVVQLLLAHHFVPHHGRGQPLAGPPQLVLCKVVPRDILLLMIIIIIMGRLIVRPTNPPTNPPTFGYCIIFCHPAGHDGVLGQPVYLRNSSYPLKKQCVQSVALLTSS